MKKHRYDGKFKSCCHKGKVKLPVLRNSNNEILEYPQFLEQMLISNPQHRYFKNFKDNIRTYNSSLSFASLGAKIAHLPGHGPYVFRVQGQIYHRTSHTDPINGENRKYAQLYVLDSSTQATEERMKLTENENCIPEVLKELDQFIRKNNSLANAYRMMKEVHQSMKIYPK